MRERLCNRDFLLLPIPLVSSVKDQFKLPKSLLVAVQCFNRNVMFCLKSANLIDFSLKLMKYSYAHKKVDTSRLPQVSPDYKVHFVAYEQKGTKIKIQAHISSIFATFCQQYFLKIKQRIL